MNNLQGINPHPNFTSIIHHYMKMGRQMILVVDSHYAERKALDNGHWIPE